MKHIWGVQEIRNQSDTKETFLKYKSDLSRRQKDL